MQLAEAASGGFHQYAESLVGGVRITAGAESPVDEHADQRPDDSGASIAAGVTGSSPPTLDATAATMPEGSSPSDGQTARSEPHRVALAIADYDTLTAANIVRLLGGLSESELIDVREHERSGRSRRTILAKVTALLADAREPT